MSAIKLIGVLFLVTSVLCEEWINIQSGSTLAVVYNTTDGLFLDLYYNGNLRLSGQIGFGWLTTGIQSIERCSQLNCIIVNGIENLLHLQAAAPDVINVVWYSVRRDQALVDCYDLGSDDWFGGPEQTYQYWPIDSIQLAHYSTVTKSDDASAIGGAYWLSSNGTYIYGNPQTPLFVDQNNVLYGRICFTGQLTEPYVDRTYLANNYYLGAASDPRAAHLNAVSNFLGKPTGHPDENMIRYPIWSTWVRYKTDFNQTVLEQFVQEIYDHDYPNSQIEVDDIWEDCYGTLTFDRTKFPDIEGAVENIHSRGFRATLWVHPFVNKVCEEISQIGLDNGYFVQNLANDTSTQWWNSDSGQARAIDFTNPNATDWFISRLRQLQEQTGFDSFKFDAGETSWVPQLPLLRGPEVFTPNVFTSNYVNAVSTFGTLIEVRSGFQTQSLPNFIRMLDKNSVWGYDAGLPTLITTLLQLNLNGYTMVLPDIIGGNAYGPPPDKELYIRWVQATALMPAIQFSYTPWDFDDETISISAEFARLHENYTPVILQAMEASINDGIPVNPPIWWIDPTDRTAHGVADEFLLGERVLVAPVIVQGAVTRDVYLPQGVWQDGNDGTIYEGPTTLYQYDAPLNKLPYFLLE